jgi:hypothetical protein
MVRHSSPSLSPFLTTFAGRIAKDLPSSPRHIAGPSFESFDCPILLASPASSQCPHGPLPAPFLMPWLLGIAGWAQPWRGRSSAASPCRSAARPAPGSPPHTNPRAAPAASARLRGTCRERAALAGRARTNRCGPGRRAGPPVRHTTCRVCDSAASRWAGPGRVGPGRLPRLGASRPLRADAAHEQARRVRGGLGRVLEGYARAPGEPRVGHPGAAPRPGALGHPGSPGAPSRRPLARVASVP